MTEELARLVQRFRSGDHQAFAELVKLFQRRVYALAYKMLMNHIEADEVTQETFVRAFNSIDQLKSPAHFGAFVYRIAANYAIDLLRKRKGRIVAMPEETELPGSIQMDLASKTADPEKVLEHKELLAVIMQAIDKLPPRQKMTVILHDIEGLPKEEVAQIMECPETTVRSNLHIARGKLKKELSKLLS